MFTQVPSRASTSFPLNPPYLSFLTTLCSSKTFQINTVRLTLSGVAIPPALPSAPPWWLSTDPHEQVLSDAHPTWSSRRVCDKKVIKFSKGMQTIYFDSEICSKVTPSISYEVKKQIFPLSVDACFGWKLFSFWTFSGQVFKLGNVARFLTKSPSLTSTI